MLDKQYYADPFSKAITLEQLEERLEMAGASDPSCSVPIHVI